jgi:hypothetical protein
VWSQMGPTMKGIRNWVPPRTQLFPSPKVGYFLDRVIFVTKKRLVKTLCRNNHCGELLQGRLVETDREDLVFEWSVVWKSAIVWWLFVVTSKSIHQSKPRL